MWTRSKFSPAIVASAALRPKPPSNGMKGRLLAALLTHGPFLGAIAADFSPAQVAKWRPRPPLFVCMQQPLHSCCRTKDHVDALAVAALCAKSHPQWLWWHRKIEISSPPWPLRAARSPIQLPHVIIDFLAPKRPPELHEGSIESL